LRLQLTLGLRFNLGFGFRLGVKLGFDFGFGLGFVLKLGFAVYVGGGFPWLVTGRNLAHGTNYGTRTTTAVPYSAAGPLPQAAAVPHTGPQVHAGEAEEPRPHQAGPGLFILAAFADSVEQAVPWCWRTTPPG
jgi:hypothetical protein